MGFPDISLLLNLIYLKCTKTGQANCRLIINKKVKWKEFITSEYEREVERDIDRDERFEW